MLLTVTLDRQLGKKAMQPKKRWYRISLYKLLLLLTFVCVCLAGYALIRKRANAQRIATSDFCNSAPQTRINDSMQFPFNGFFVYDYQIEAHETFQYGMFAPQPSPHWLAGWLGVDFVHNVELVGFELPVNTELINRLRDLPGLKTVIVDNGFADQSAWNALVRCRQLEKLHYVVSSSVHGHEAVPIKFQQLASLAHLNEFQIQSGDLTLEQLSEIAAAKSIKTLRLIYIHIEREDLLNFPEMDQVESFFWRININPFDDDEFHFIEKMPNVKRLALAGSLYWLTDKAFLSVEKLSRLEELSFHGSNLTGSELHRLKNLPRLVKLELGASKLNDDALKTISELRQLEHLEIGSTDVTDEGMKHVARLNNLQHLSIRDTDVSNVGLRQLGTLSSLRFLRIRDTKITESGIAAFRKKHPNCLVEKQ